MEQAGYEFSSLHQEIVSDPPGGGGEAAGTKRTEAGTDFFVF
jgi:hypothetical protein